jgi:ABC-2 type transport system permease protein
VTAVLYFLIFGTVLGSQIGKIQGVTYMQFVVPGLVMLSVVTSSYANTSFTFFASKFFARSIDEILVSPTPPWVMIAGFIGGGIIRGLIIGTTVLIVSVFFTGLTVSVHNALIVLFFGLLTALVFALAGLVNGIYAKSMDGINIVPTFVLTPLVYLGGIFYSVHSLPSWWQTITYMDPLFYLINGFRYGLLGVTDVPVYISVSMMLTLVVVLIGINWYLIRKGLGLRQ